MKDIPLRFEMMVDDVKTSRTKKDTCPLSGEFEYHGREGKISMVFTSDDQAVFDDMFDGVGRTVTFQIVKNAQTSLVEEEQVS